MKSERRRSMLAYTYRRLGLWMINHQLSGFRKVSGPTPRSKVTYFVVQVVKQTVIVGIISRWLLFLFDVPDWLGEP